MTMLTWACLLLYVNYFLIFEQPIPFDLFCHNQIAVIFNLS